jgi:hypothetical protein
LSITVHAQIQGDKVDGLILSNTTKQPLSSVNIINVNKVRGATTNSNGYFEIDVQVNDTLYQPGFSILAVRVTKRLDKNKSTKIQLTEKLLR